jgi:hypothetical protein
MSVNNKILRTANAPTTAPDETEISVAQALIDLENNVPDLKAELRPLQISAAREVDVRGGKKAIVIFVPVPQLKAFHKVQQRYVVSSSNIILKLTDLLGSHGNWRKNSQTDMWSLSLNAGCYANLLAHPESSKSGLVAELSRMCMKRSSRISYSLPKLLGREPEWLWTAQNY